MSTSNRTRYMQRSAVALLAFGLLPWASHAESAREWLSRMSDAVERLNYEGTLVNMQGSEVETLFIIHRYADGEVSERIVAMDGPGREIIRHQDQVTCIFPDQRRVLVDERTDVSPLVAALPAYSEELERHYGLSLGGSARVAGRQARKVEIKPKDAYRYGYTLWLDEETGMPLKSQLEDERGDMLEQLKFTKIELPDSIPASAIASQIDTTGFRFVRAVPDQERPLAASRWRVGGLPAGFRLSFTTVKVMSGSDTPVEHRVYSDGLASVSVFIEDPANTEVEAMTGFSRVGSTNAFSRRLNGHTVTAVGEVPRTTVRSIAISLVPAPSQ